MEDKTREKRIIRTRKEVVGCLQAVGGEKKFQHSILIWAVKGDE